MNVLLYSLTFVVFIHILHISYMKRRIRDLESIVSGLNKIEDDPSSHTKTKGTVT